MLQKYVKKETLAKLDECAKYMSSPEYWEHAHSMDEYKKIVEGLFLLFFFQKKLKYSNKRYLTFKRLMNQISLFTQFFLITWKNTIEYY